jgi:hypothetical protein
MKFKEFLTDPREHNPGNFVYLVHGILDYGNGTSLFEMERRTEGVKDPDQFYRASMVACLDKKTAIEKLSYHDDVHQVATFGDVGIIIDPTDNDLVQIAWNCDIGSPADPEELRKFVEEHKGKVKYPCALLTQTLRNPLYNYNELILKGDKGTKIKGVFYREGNIESERKAGRLVGFVESLYEIEIPVIGLPPRKRPDYENIDPKDRELAEQSSRLIDEVRYSQLMSEFLSPVREYGMNYSLPGRRLPSREQMEAANERLGRRSIEEIRATDELIKSILGDKDVKA